MAFSLPPRPNFKSTLNARTAASGDFTGDATSQNFLTPDAVWSAATAYALADAATIQIDFSQGFNFLLPLVANRVVGPALFADKEGQSGVIRVVPTGAFTLSWDASFGLPGDAAPAIAPSPSVTLIPYNIQAGGKVVLFPPVSGTSL